LEISNEFTLPPLASSDLFGIALFLGDGNQISFTVTAKMLHRITCLINIVTESLRVNVHPFKPITGLVFVLKSQCPLAQLATFGDFVLSVLAITFIFRISRVDRIRDELSVISHQHLEMFEKSGESFQVLHNPHV
jgi:hypothetical protein